MIPVITYKEAVRLMLAKESAEISLDLGKSHRRISVTDGNASIDGSKIPIAELKNLKEGTVYALEEGKLHKVEIFSEETQLYYKLIPTSDWPTVAISSTPMHRFTHVSPREDTLTKIAEISPVKGNVLDTCCGAGYTAVLAAEEAIEVQTYERDQNMVTIAKYNPYSSSLFTDPKIKLTMQSIAEAISGLKSDYFDRIIHDPPTFKLSPELYTVEFYEELYRVLKPGGIMYHYAPMPGKTKGKEFHLSIMDKLGRAGFKNPEYHQQSSGIRAVK